MNSKAERIDRLIRHLHNQGQFNGTVLVAENSQITLKKGYGYANREWQIKNDADTVFKLASLSKQFTAMLVLQLIAQQEVSLAGSITDYLPYYRKDTGRVVTIHHLLNHTSGIPSYTNLPEFFDIVRTSFTVEDFVKEYCSGELDFEPGSKYAYNNSGYHILGAIIETVTGESYEDVITQRIFKPLGMKNSGYFNHEKVIPKMASGYIRTSEGYVHEPFIDCSLPYAEGGLYSTAEDMFKWDQALYTDALLPKEYLAKMFTPNLGNYGYGWGIISLPINEIPTYFKDPSAEIKWHEGLAGRTITKHEGGHPGFNTYITRILEDQHLIVLLSNHVPAGLTSINQGIIEILYGLGD